MSLWRTNRMPWRQSRSGTGRGPGDLSGQGGSNGSISAHRSSSTIHGRVVTPSRTAESSHRSRPTRTDQQDRVTSSSCVAGRNAGVRPSVQVSSTEGIARTTFSPLRALAFSATRPGQLLAWSPGHYLPGLPTCSPRVLANVRAQLPPSDTQLFPTSRVSREVGMTDR